MRTYLFRPTMWLPCAILAIATGSSNMACAQDPASEYYWGGVDPALDPTGEYGTATNWLRSLDGVSPVTPAAFVPEAQAGEVAIVGLGGGDITNGNNIPDGGTATVNGPVLNGATEATPGALLIENGTVRIASGQLKVVAFNGESPFFPGSFYDLPGSTEVINDGVLEIAGGELRTESLNFTDNPGFNGLPNSAVTATSSGTLSLDIQSGTITPIQVTGSATLGGTLEASFSQSIGPTDSWTIVDAGSVAGSFNTLTASGVTLTDGQFLATREVANGARTEVELFVDQPVLLQVDRSTGVATMSKQYGDSVNIDGYQIRSEGGALNPAGLTPLGGDFVVSNTSANQVAELNPEFSGPSPQLIGATHVGLGAIYTPPTPTEFRVNPSATDDLVFQYTTDSGEIVDGVVSYVGSLINDLVLKVDPVDGDVQLTNPSGFQVDIDAYQITSSMDSLVPANWQSLDDADGAGNNDGGWRESPASTAFMAELNEDSTLSVTSVGKYLGSIYDFASAQEDLVFSFLMAGDSAPLVGTVVYEEFAPSDADFGDFNADGAVDLADYTVWRNNLGGPASGISNNGSGGTTVTAADYQIWKQFFGTDYTGGAVVTGSAQVPEPTSSVVMALGVGLFVAFQVVRPRRQKQA